MIEEAINLILTGMDVNDVVDLVSEEKDTKKYQTPKFVQHCVTAVLKDNPGMDKSRAFAICYGQRNKGKAKGKSYERKHSKEHTKSDRREFEKAIDYKGKR